MINKPSNQDILLARPTPVAGVVWQVVEGEALLVIPGRGQVKVLNEVGSRIWSLADGSLTVGEIVEVICREYDVEYQQARADVLEFVNQLVERGILTLL